MSGTSWSLVLLCAVHVVVAAAIASWSYRRRRTAPAARAFAALVATEGLWSLGHLGETLAPSLDAKIALDALQYLPMGAIGATSLWLAYDFIGVRRGGAALVVISALGGACALVLASAALGLHAHDHTRLVGSPPMLVYDFSPWDLLLSVFALGATLFAAVTVLRRFVGENALYAAPTTALGTALALPALGTLLAMSLDLKIDGDRDVTPVTFTLAAAIAAWGLRRRLFDIGLIAREVVLARLPDPVLVFSRDLRLIDINPAAAALLADPRRERLGCAAEDALARLPGLAALLGGQNSDEVEVTDGDRWFAVIATPLMDSRHHTLGHTLVLRDVTLRKARSSQLAASVDARTAELAASEGRFRALFDEVVSLVGLLDREGRVLAANRAALDMIGVREEALRGVAFWDTPWWNHDAATQAQIRDAVARAAGGEPVRFQSHHIDRSGKRHDVDFSLTPVRDASGAVVELIPEGRDLTALHEERARAERLAEQLRQGQKLESIGRLAGGIAHDFNNLLTVIRGNADEARATLPPASPALAPVNEIVEAADAAAQITRQLLTFSRSQPMTIRPVAMADVLASSKRLLGRLLRADVDLRFDVQAELWVRADATQLQQIVMNLALNAQDAMPGGGRLSIAVDDIVLDQLGAEEIAGARPGRQVRLTVRDTGTGMDEETRARLFEPFFTTKPEGKGTGLGLAVVHGAVYQAGGAIAVQSRPGRGTMFSLYFPRVDPPPATAPEAAIAPTPVLAGTRTIVLVEDQPALCKVIARHFGRCGYRLHVFSSPDELRARAASLDPRPDLLLTDVMLPGMNGVELARAVAPLWPGLRVLFMSGYTADISISGMQSVTEEMLISKPFGLAELMRRVESVLSSAPAYDVAS